MFSHAYASRSETVVQCRKLFSAADFFKDTPWLNVPLHLQADVIVEPLYPRGGLLGGASGNTKPSKLAQLAAARKKKEEEKKAREQTSPTPQSSSNAVSLLDRLGDEPVPNDDIHNDNTTQKAIKLPVRQRQPSPPKLQTELRGTPKDPAKSIDEELDREQSEPKLDPKTSSQDTLRANPSPFALTMIGSYAPHQQSSPKQRPYSSQSFQFPSHNQENFFEANHAFSGPSPDDVVEQAQAKGTRLGLGRN